MASAVWATTVGVSAYGVRFTVRVSDASLLDAALRRLPPGWQRAEPCRGRRYGLRLERGLYELWQGRSFLARSADLEALLDAFQGQTHLHVAEHAASAVFVHAGVVAWDGKAMLLPGRSMAGKSTLVLALLRAGATYLSDNYAVLDHRGRVRPFARPLALRDGPDEPRRRCDAEELGAQVATGALPVRWIVATRYLAGSRWNIKRTSRGRAALALLANAVSARRHPAEVLAALRQAVADAATFEGERGEADEAADQLRRLANGQSSALDDGEQWPESHPWLACGQEGVLSLGPAGRQNLVTVACMPATGWGGPRQWRSRDLLGPVLQRAREVGQHRGR